MGMVWAGVERASNFRAERDKSHGMLLLAKRKFSETWKSLLPLMQTAEFVPSVRFQRRETHSRQARRRFSKLILSPPAACH